MYVATPSECVPLQSDGYSPGVLNLPYSGNPLRVIVTLHFNSVVKHWAGQSLYEAFFPIPETKAKMFVLWGQTPAEKTTTHHA